MKGRLAIIVKEQKKKNKRKKRKEKSVMLGKSFNKQMFENRKGSN
jgi:hypothetical protein